MVWIYTVCFLKAEEEVNELTTQLAQLEDELDAAESQLQEISSKLIEAEKTADESERYVKWMQSFELAAVLKECSNGSLIPSTVIDHIRSLYLTNELLFDRHIVS